MNEITWGDAVQISETAPAELRPGEVGACVGFHEYSDQTIYTVEFGDGTAVQVPSRFLSKAEISN